MEFCLMYNFFLIDRMFKEDSFFYLLFSQLGFFSISHLAYGHTPKFYNPCSCIIEQVKTGMPFWQLNNQFPRMIYYFGWYMDDLEPDHFHPFLFPFPLEHQILHQCIQIKRQYHTPPPGRILSKGT